MLTERSKVPSEAKKRYFFPAKNPVDARRREVVGTPKFRMSPLTRKPGARVLGLSLSPRFSCFENDATNAYPNRHDFPVLKMTQLTHAQISMIFLF
jgi:hypothetical protein